MYLGGEAKKGLPIENRVSAMTNIKTFMIKLENWITSKCHII